MSWSFYDANGKMLQGVLAVSIDTTELADDAVTADKLANLAVTNAKLADDAVGADELAANAVVDASIASGAAIDATKIANGSVTSTEFQYIHTLSSNAQTQISAKAPIAGATFTGTTQFATLSDGTIAVTAWVDEDNMSSNSATLIPTQQSVKAYVDTTATIADDSIVEAKFDVSNGPTNGQFLQAQSGGGGLTWATVAGATPAKVMAYQI